MKVFLRKKCKIVPMFVEQYVHGLLSTRGIYSVDMLLDVVRSNSSNELKLIVSNAVHLMSIASIAATKQDATSKSPQTTLDVSKFVLFDCIPIIIAYSCV